MTPERKQRLLSVINRRQVNLTVLLENVFDPHNISAVLRSCDAVGIQNVYVLNTKLPPHQRWGYRSSSGAYKWVTVHQFTNLETCIAEIRKKYQTILTSSLNHDSVGLYKIDFTKSMALVFGNENTGVSKEIQQVCDGNFMIPQVGMIRSLNISVACAVTIYEAYRQKELAGHYQKQNLPAAEGADILTSWGLNEDD
jgi:tRNA (guanosine-2'-O-)-methyltransferase